MVQSKQTCNRTNAVLGVKWFHGNKTSNSHLFTEKRGLWLLCRTQQDQDLMVWSCKDQDEAPAEKLDVMDSWHFSVAVVWLNNLNLGRDDSLSEGNGRNELVCLSFIFCHRVISSSQIHSPDNMIITTIIPVLVSLCRHQTNSLNSLITSLCFYFYAETCPEPLLWKSGLINRKCYRQHWQMDFYHNVCVTLLNYPHISTTGENPRWVSISLLTVNLRL